MSNLDLFDETKDNKYYYPDEIFIENNEIFYVYEPSDISIQWFLDKLKGKTSNLKEFRSVKVKGTFYFLKKDIKNVDKDDNRIIFKIGEVCDNYYKIYKNVLKTTFDVFFSIETKLKFDLFNYNGAKYENLFSMIDKVIEKRKELYIGGEKGDINFSDYLKMTSLFPNQWERQLYLESRVSQAVETHFNNVIPYYEKLEKYRSKKQLTIKREEIFTELKNYEIEKYTAILTHLKNMLEEADKYSEEQWQVEIAKVILFIFPKYIYFFEKETIKLHSSFSNKRSEKPDFLLITSNGNVDILEIKKASNMPILSNSTTRDNYVPSNSLSATIMQAEKYLYHLNKLGYQFEVEINSKYKDKLPNNLKINVVNPKAMIIIGMNNTLNEKQLHDLEVIKKMYSNMMEIMTYDDIINRLENIIYMLENSN